ncbi:uncharacterized oxidoreductase YjmC-like [Apostichopus japonicus]|uniref:uncharacterized oxidoreductase YjmC-like n=1 Tax=Stichopus japonicus TaxID=307972 RepID=UPI003AB183A2
MSTDSLHVQIPKAEVLKFCEACMQSAGANKDHGRQLSEVLFAADYRGHFSHGLNRLPMYVRDIQAKITEKDGEPQILKESAGTAWVDGKNLLGPVVGNFCMDLAIKKAKDAGIGWVVAKGSNHYGIAGWYSLRALDQGLMGISMTNTSPLSAPTRSKEAVLGTNPMSFSAPGKDGDSFVLDMATTTVALGKIEMQKRKNEKMPLGWGQGADGVSSEDPRDVTDRGGCLQPLGGPEITGGYKGYGLSALVEIFCGILGGAHYGPNVRKWMSTQQEADLGQMFAAINPACFCDGFEDRLSDFMGMLRGLDPAEADKPVLVAGDPERQHMAKVDKDGGITYHKNLITSMNELAAELKVTPMKLL